MLIRRYILIFTLALISCAGKNYIHSITDQKSEKSIKENDRVEMNSEVDKSVVEIKGIKNLEHFNRFI